MLGLFKVKSSNITVVSCCESGLERKKRVENKLILRDALCKEDAVFFTYYYIFTNKTWTRCPCQHVFIPALVYYTIRSTNMHSSLTVTLIAYTT